MDCRTTTVTLIADNGEEDVVFQFRLEEGALYFDGMVIEPFIPDSNKFSEAYCIYENCLDHGEKAASIVANFNPQNEGDLDEICTEITEVYEFLDALVIMLVNEETISPSYTVKDCVLTVESTGKTHVLGNYFDDMLDEESESECRRMYDIIKDLH